MTDSTTTTSVTGAARTANRAVVKPDQAGTLTRARARHAGRAGRAGLGPWRQW